MIGRIIINGIPVNVWPIPNRLHLRDLTDIEDVEYIEIAETTLIRSDEETKRDD